MWGELFPDQCGTEMMRQSPINIKVDDAVHDERLNDIDVIEPSRNDTEKRMYLYNNGHSGINNKSFVRAIQHMKRPFNPSSTQPAATTNKGAAATAFLGGMQATFARACDTIGTQGEGVYTS